MKFKSKEQLTDSVHAWVIIHMDYNDLFENMYAKINATATMIFFLYFIGLGKMEKGNWIPTPPPKKKK